jgi:hypothetical protein
MRKKRILYISILFILLVLLTLYRHNSIASNTFRSEIWADRAGYYVYLPSSFSYNYSTKSFPDNIEELTGEGFTLKTGKVITKYTYGVALLQSPFYFLADILTSLSNYHRDGFSFFYQKAINIASAFYLVIALYLLFLSLKVHTNYNNKIIFVTLTILFFGTNLYYYSVIETGMSHVYSFFAFSCILYLITNKPIFKFQYTYNIILSLLVCLAILIRPTNIIFSIVPFTWNTTSIKQIYFNIRTKFEIVQILIWLISFSLIFIPQFIYWKYAYGSYLTYSYSNESFSNFLSPNIMEVIFSPHNGLLPYSFAFIGILTGIILHLKYKSWEAIRYLIIVLLLIYLTASWHDWIFGCGAGMRNMVEYYSILSFPLCFFINWINSINKVAVKISIFICISFLVIISFKVNYHYFGCYFGTTWDWTDYLNTLTYPIKIK